MDATEDTPARPERPLPPGLPASVVQRRAAVERIAMARQAHMAALLFGVKGIDQGQFLARSQAWMDDLQLRAAEEDLSPRDVALLATAWRKFASFHARLAGWERAVPGAAVQVNMHAGQGGPNPPHGAILDAAEPGLDDWRRKQLARLREMDAAPVPSPPTDDEGDAE